MDTKPLTWKATVTGLVQGVYFRAFTREAAAELKIRGWVRNMPDGSVQALMQHEDESQLAALIARLRQGPPASRVAHVSFEPVECDEVYESFEIVRG